jgi:ribose-phosphate pyrophosphokinase
MDLHADQIQGFFFFLVDHLYASSLFYPFIKKLNLNAIVVATPDVGGTKRANTYSKLFGVPMVVCHKYRSKANEIDEMRVIGDVEGKNVIIFDDMVDTAGTLTKATELMLEGGAISVRAFATHAVLSGPAYERIEKSNLVELYVTDSIPLKKESKKIKSLSIAPILAETIERVYNLRSVSTQFLI